MTTTEQTAPAPAAAGGGKAGGKGGRRGLARLPLLYREVWAELHKVIWPTRSELLGYTAVVLVFVTVFIVIVAGFDFAFTKGVLRVFG